MAERLVCPFRRSDVIAQAKRETAALLQEMRPLDRRVGRAKPFGCIRIVRLCPDALAGVPQQSAEFAKNSRFADAVRHRAVPLQRALVVLLGRASATCHTAEVRDPLVQDQPLRIPFAAGQQHGERLLVEADGIVVGIARACAIAGRAQIVRAFGLLALRLKWCPSRMRSSSRSGALP